MVIRLKIPLCEELIKCGKGLRVLLGLLMCVEDALEAIGVEVEKVAGDCKNRDFKNQVYLLEKLFYFNAPVASRNCFLTKYLAVRLLQT